MIVATNHVLPSIKRIGSGIIRLDYVNHENCKAENDACNQGPLEKNSVAVRGIILTVEGLSSAGNSTGKTVLVALLKKNCYDDEYCRDRQNDEKYVL